MHPHGYSSAECLKEVDTLTSKKHGSVTRLLSSAKPKLSINTQTARQPTKTGFTVGVQSIKKTCTLAGLADTSLDDSKQLALAHPLQTRVDQGHRQPFEQFP